MFATAVNPSNETSQIIVFFIAGPSDLYMNVFNSFLEMLELYHFALASLVSTVFCEDHVSPDFSNVC